MPSATSSSRARAAERQRPSQAPRRPRPRRQAVLGAAPPGPEPARPGGLTGFLEEYEIYTADGRFLARPDFVFVRQRVVVEADSIRHHAGTVDFAANLDRRNRLTAEHWSMLHVTWADLRHRRAQRQDEIRRALAAPGPGSSI